MKSWKLITLIVGLALLLSVIVILYSALGPARKNAKLSSIQQEKLIADEVAKIKASTDIATQKDHQWVIETYGKQVNELYYRDQARAHLIEQGYIITIT